MASSLSRFHYHTQETPYSIGLLWTRDQPNAETSTWQHTIPRNRHPCPMRDSKPRSQRAKDCRNTYQNAGPLVSAVQSLVSKNLSASKPKNVSRVTDKQALTAIRHLNYIFMPSLKITYWTLKRKGSIDNIRGRKGITRIIPRVSSFGHGWR